MSTSFDLVGVGLNATDTLILLPEFPPYAGKIAFTEELLSPGGQVATAVVQGAKLGLRTKYIGTIGDDYRGQVQAESLSGTGVDIESVIVRKDCPNQTAYILIDGSTGERTVLWQRSGGLRLAPSDVQKEDIASSRLLHIDGFDRDAAVYAASVARECAIPVSLDVDTVYPDFDSVLRHVDYLVASSSWPGLWTGEPDAFAALAVLQREYRFSVAAMTLGDRGSLALHNGEWTYEPAFQVGCQDTTGAGDAFHGAFCYAMLQNMPMSAALRFSNAAAAINCTAIGARGHLPTFAEVSALVASASAGKISRRTDIKISERLAEEELRTVR